MLTLDALARIAFSLDGKKSSVELKLLAVSVTTLETDCAVRRGWCNHTTEPEDPHPGKVARQLSATGVR